MVSVVQKPQEAFQGSQVGCKSRRARSQPGLALTAGWPKAVCQDQARCGIWCWRAAWLGEQLGDAHSSCTTDRCGACLEPRGTKSHLPPPRYLDNSQDAGLAGRVSNGTGGSWDLVL